jgi:hypothetical protein
LWGAGLGKDLQVKSQYIYPEHDNGTSGCASYEQFYCPYWGCERWATLLKEEVHTSHGTAALLQKRKTTPTCILGTCNPVNFTIFNLNETGWEVGKNQKPVPLTS